MTPTASIVGLRHILIVDDEPTQCFALQIAIRKMENFQAMTASNGVEALDLIERHSFDLMITDYRMPEMDGLELVRRVRSLSPQTKIIMMTAFANDSMRQSADELGIGCLLDKPIRLADIRAAIMNVLA